MSDSFSFEPPPITEVEPTRWERLHFAVFGIQPECYMRRLRAAMYEDDRNRARWIAELHAHASGRERRTHGMRDIDEAYAQIVRLQDEAEDAHREVERLCAQRDRAERGPSAEGRAMAPRDELHVALARLGRAVKDGGGVQFFVGVWVGMVIMLVVTALT